MALIPIEGSGAPSQKTCLLLGGVAQILILPRPSSRLADVRLFVRPKSQQSLPRTKSLHASSTIFTPEDQMLHRDPTLHCVGLRHTLYEVPTTVGHSSTPCNRRAPITRSTTIKFLESPTLASQGPIAPFTPVAWPGPVRYWGGSYIVEHHPHRAWLLYHLKHLGHHPKRLAF